jgi:hypothetical protein
VEQSHGREKVYAALFPTTSGATESRDSKDITGIEAFILHKDGDIRPLVNALGSVCKRLVGSNVVLVVTSDLVVGNDIFSRNPLDGAADRPLLRHTKCVTESPPKWLMVIGTSRYSVSPSEPISLAPIKHVSWLGGLLGVELGRALGVPLGTVLGDALGADVGLEVGEDLGVMVGAELGFALGGTVGPEVGKEDGPPVGTSLDCSLGAALGKELGSDEGGELGSLLGTPLGD